MEKDYGQNLHLLSKKKKKAVYKAHLKEKQRSYWNTWKEKGNWTQMKEEQDTGGQRQDNQGGRNNNDPQQWHKESNKKKGT